MVEKGFQFKRVNYMASVMTGHVPYMEDSGIEGDWIRGVSLYSKPKLLRPPLCLRKNGLYSGWSYY